MKLQKIFTAFLAVLFITTIRAQVKEKVLQKPISIRASEIRVDSLLKKFSKQTGVEFSFNSNKISPSKKITVTKQMMTLDQWLAALTHSMNINYKLVGSHIILVDKPQKNTAIQNPLKSMAQTKKSTAVVEKPPAKKGAKTSVNVSKKEFTNTYNVNKKLLDINIKIEPVKLSIVNGLSADTIQQITTRLEEFELKRDSSFKNQGSITNNNGSSAKTKKTKDSNNYIKRQRVARDKRSENKGSKRGGRDNSDNNFYSNYRTPSGALTIRWGGPATVTSGDFEKIFNIDGIIQWSVHAGLGLNYDTLSDNNNLYLNVPLGMALHIPVTNNKALQLTTGINSTFGGKTLYKTGFIISGTVGMRYYLRKILFFELAYSPHISKVYTYWSGSGFLLPSYEKVETKQWTPMSMGIGIFFNEK